MLNFEKVVVVQLSFKGKLWDINTAVFLHQFCTIYG